MAEKRNEHFQINYDLIMTLKMSYSTKCAGVCIIRLGSDWFV